jgi:DNA-binding transcriptional ArsR family regulator
MLPRSRGTHAFSPKESVMAYTPELALSESRALRRIAWALGKPMTKTMQEIFSWLPKHIDSELVCNKCRDKSVCDMCPFKCNGKDELACTKQVGL